MKKICFKILFTIVMLFSLNLSGHAVQFDLLVLPSDLFNVCDNYFCYPEPSEIASKYIIDELSYYKTMNIIPLNTVRSTLQTNQNLKNITEGMLNQFKLKDTVDFDTLKLLSKEFNVKSVILVSAYSTSDKNSTRRSLWEIFEISSAFKISYPFNLVTNVVLTDTVNNVVMWSSKYSKNVSDTNGYFYAKNQAQAASQLEKIKQYYKDNVSYGASQNIYLRFFPKDVRTFEVKRNDGEEREKPHFVPNALEHLIQPQVIKELDDGALNTLEPDDLMFAL